MARIRTIKPELWEDEIVGSLSRDARLLFIGLISLADDDGRFRARPSNIRAELYRYDEDLTNVEVQSWLQELEQVNRIQLYEAQGQSYGVVCNFKRHQKIDKATQSRLPAPPSPDGSPSPRRDVVDSSSSPRRTVDDCSADADVITDARAEASPTPLRRIGSGIRDLEGNGSQRAPEEPATSGSTTDVQLAIQSVAANLGHFAGCPLANFVPSAHCTSCASKRKGLEEARLSAEARDREKGLKGELRRAGRIGERRSRRHVRARVGQLVLGLEDDRIGAVE